MRDQKPWVVLASLVLMSIGMAAAATPCSCDELTMSGAGNTRINGTYAYEPFITNQDYFEGTDMWLGPAYSVGSIHGHWALLHVAGDTWVCGVFVVFSGGVHQIYVISGYYVNLSRKRCPPETGWVAYDTLPAPTIERDGCLCVGIGDVDGDGELTVVDARLCFLIAIDLMPGTADQRTAADVDEDGDVDRDDAGLLAQQLIGVCP